MGCLNSRSASSIISGSSNNSPTAKDKPTRRIAVMGLKDAGESAVIERLRSMVKGENRISGSFQMERVKTEIVEVNMLSSRGIKKGLLQSSDAVIFVINSSSSDYELLAVKEELAFISKDLEFEDTVLMALFNYGGFDSLSSSTSSSRATTGAPLLSTLIHETGMHEQVNIDLILSQCSARTGLGVCEAWEKLTKYLDNRANINKAFEISSTTQDNSHTNVKQELVF